MDFILQTKGKVAKVPPPPPSPWKEVISMYLNIQYATLDWRQEEGWEDVTIVHVRETEQLKRGSVSGDGEEGTDLIAVMFINLSGLRD